jgi:hypothetical protein
MTKLLLNGLGVDRTGKVRVLQGYVGAAVRWLVVAAHVFARFELVLRAAIRALGLVLIGNI